MSDQGYLLDLLRELLTGVDPEKLRQVMPLVGGSVITMMFTDIAELDAAQTRGRRPDLFRGARSTQ